MKGYVIIVECRQPELGNNTADAERLAWALEDQIKDGRVFIPMHLIRRLPATLRRWNHRLKCVLFRDLRGWRLVDILNPNGEELCCGLAVDLGTTRVILRLVDLETGESLGEAGMDNPQGVVAPDVLARIHHASSREGLEELQGLIIQGMNPVIGELCRSAGTPPGSIRLVSAAGNTAMTHLFLGLDPGRIIREPYIPAVNVPGPVAADELGLGVSPGAMVYLFPNIGAYFGGDLIAGILYSGIHRAPKPGILVDVGTNAEVVVGNREWLIACAGAAGPALEGGVSDIGMTAGPGVIDRVRIDPESCAIKVHTIDEKPPVGICGSGMIDLAAQLFLAGMVDIQGRFSRERCGNRLVLREGIPAFRLVDEAESGTGEGIYLSQVDMNSLTSSKAAMYSILEVIVMGTADLRFQDLEAFYVAGTFGSFIDPVSAISIGMLPDMPIEKFKVLGNSSLEGATLMLTDPGAFDEVETIRRGITYVELNVNQEFMNIFSGAKFYPHTDRSRFPSVTLHPANLGEGED